MAVAILQWIGRFRQAQPVLFRVHRSLRLVRCERSVPRNAGNPMLRLIIRCCRWFPASLLAMLAISWILLICESAGSPPDFVNPTLDGATRGLEPRTGALLLNNGRLVEGRISESSTGYVVDFPNGSMLVPYGQVRLEGRNRRDAFQKYRDTITSPTATTHIALARWCIVNQLYDDAYSQLHAALKLEPENKDARATLKRLDETLLSSSKAAAASLDTEGSKGKGNGVKTAHAVQEEDLPDVESLGGLSRNTAREWTSHVQPLLVNKCGNTSCHGGSENRGLHLHRVSLSIGVARTPAERNLASAAKFIDRASPDNSRLLVVPRGNHGPNGRSIFVGQAGRTQYGILRRWVHLAAKDLGPEKSPNRPNIGLGQQVSLTRPADQPPFLEHDQPTPSPGKSGTPNSGKASGGKPTPGRRKVRPQSQQNRASASRGGSSSRAVGPGSGERARQPTANPHAPPVIPKEPARPLEMEYVPTPALKAARDRQYSNGILRELREHDKSPGAKGFLPGQAEPALPLIDSLPRPSATSGGRPASSRKVEADAFDPDRFNSAPERAP